MKERTNTIVKQSHDLNMAKYNLSPLTIDLLHVYLAQIKKEDEEFISFKFNIGALEKKLDKQIDRRYLDSVTTELLTTIIKVKLDTKKELKTSWCASAIYDSEENTLELEISKHLKSFLLNVRDRFVLSDYRILSKLKGSYTKRIYLMLSQFSSTGVFRIKLDLFREQLDVIDKYTVHSDFKKRILNHSIKQINDLLDINLTLEEEKNGRKIETLVFKFNKAKYAKKTQSFEEENIENSVEKWLKNSEEDIIDVEIN